ncbi:hypothetical protein ABI59_14265 [Acidobacteria bacterium Mor1]|nr:hypothetical protein ABI59_14265 [Acidobacteria bacterium Mor1]
MIRPGMVLAIAAAESRLTRRLVRFWIFQVIAMLAAIAFSAYYSVLHRQFSWFSGTIGMLNPRYLIGFVGIYYLVLFLIGLIFLGFDIRARDTRERMDEVLDSLPMTNAELMCGRFLGILWMSWIPVVLAALIMWTITAIAGSPAQPVSLISFVFILAIPAYTLALGLVFFLTMLVKHRLVAAILSILIVGAFVVSGFYFAPIYVLPLLDVTGGFTVPNPSDLVPTLLDGRTIVQRVGAILAGLGMLWLAIGLHPRRDDSNRALTFGLGGLMLAVGIGLCAMQVWQAKGIIETRKQLADVHRARAEEPAPDVQRITGRVDIGKSGLELNLAMTVAAPAESTLDSALFSLNPGIAVESISADGQNLGFTHDQGLLEVELPRSLSGDATLTLDIAAAGYPQTEFAYLDGVIEPLDVDVKDANLFLLGFETHYLNKYYAALMPGAVWFPRSGPATGSRQDFFELDLEVGAPDGWLVAGPGKRQDAGNGFRFAPRSPVPEFALMAAKFADRSIEIDGVELELLVSPSHVRNLDVFEEAVPRIEEWVSSRLQEAADHGVAYPYDGLTVVEVPNGLRGYGGGWRHESTLAQPGMILMRESGFPTARFDVAFEEDQTESMEDDDGGVPQAQLDALLRFFENDFSGGNPFVAASKNFFSYQTAGTGEFGLPMNFVLDDVSTKLVTDRQGYFSVHHFGAEIGQVVGETITRVFANDESATDAMIGAVTARSEVWDSTLNVSLVDLDPWESPKRSLDVLTLKGGAMADSLLDELGPAQVGELLGALRERYPGDVFEADDLVAVGAEIGVDMQSWVDVWLNQTQIPGFTQGTARYMRLEDSEDGSPRYQVLVRVQNDEPIAGLVKIDYRIGKEDDQDRPRQSSDPVRIDGLGAVEIGIVASEPIHSVRVDPYLSLNREPFQVNLPSLDEEKLVDAEPVLGFRIVERDADDSGIIVVDDLDEGFRVVDEQGTSLLRVGGKRSTDVELDQGLPVAQAGQTPSEWSRRVSRTSWGRYRHTTALIGKGSGNKFAVFEGDIPNAGPWELQIHLPSARNPKRRGAWSLVVEDSSGTRDVDFDAAAGDDGWNSLGIHELAGGSVKVRLSNANEGGRYVAADAIRWIPQTSGAGKDRS